MNIPPYVVQLIKSMQVYYSNYGAVRETQWKETNVDIGTMRCLLCLNYRAAIQLIAHGGTVYLNASDSLV